MTVRQLRTDLVVWLDPGRRAAPAELVRALQAAVRLVVVPRTGRRRADAAVLLAPSVEVLGRVRRVLPDAVLLAVPDEPPGQAFLDLAQWEGVHVLGPGASPEEVVGELLAVAQRVAAARRGPAVLDLPGPREAEPVVGADAVVDEVAALLGLPREELLGELLRSDRLQGLAHEHRCASEVAARVRALEPSPAR